MYNSPVLPLFSRFQGLLGRERENTYLCNIKRPTWTVLIFYSLAPYVVKRRGFSYLCNGSKISKYSKFSKFTNFYYKTYCN